MRAFDNRLISDQSTFEQASLPHITWVVTDKGLLRFYCEYIALFTPTSDIIFLTTGNSSPNSGTHYTFPVK